MRYRRAVTVPVDSPEDCGLRLDVVRARQQRIVSYVPLACAFPSFRPTRPTSYGRLATARSRRPAGMSARERRARPSCTWTSGSGARPRDEQGQPIRDEEGRPKLEWVQRDRALVKLYYVFQRRADRGVATTADPDRPGAGVGGPRTRRGADQAQRRPGRPRGRRPRLLQREERTRRAASSTGGASWPIPPARATRATSNSPTPPPTTPHSLPSRISAR